MEGHVEDVLRVGISLAERLGKHPLLSHVARLSRFIPRPHSRRKDAKDVSFHYDVSNDFYHLWLDRQMIYSCAYFRTGAEDIDTGAHKGDSEASATVALFVRLLLCRPAARSRVRLGRIAVLGGEALRRNWRRDHP